MMPSIFRKSEPAAPAVGPAFAVLHGRLHEISELRVKLAAIAAPRKHAERQVADELAAAIPVAGLRDQIDQVLADAAYAGEPTPDVSALEGELRNAEAAHRRAGAVARSAVLVLKRLAADTDEVNKQITTLSKDVASLTHAALLEVLDGLRPEFEAAQESMRAVHRRVFTVALAADRLSMAEKFGVFVGSGRHFDLNIPKPSTYEPQFADDIARGRALEASHAQLREDAIALEQAADLFINKLLDDARSD